MPRHALSAFALIVLLAAAPFAATPAAADMRGKAKTQVNSQTQGMQMRSVRRPTRDAASQNLNSLQVQEAVSQRQRAMQTNRKMLDAQNRSSRQMIKNCPQCF